MKQISKNHAILLMFLLMASTIVIDGLLESTVADPLRTPAMAFSLSIGTLSILERSGVEKWPKTTLAHKAASAGIAALVLVMLRLIPL